jgi:hypothetical protein
MAPEVEKLGRQHPSHDVNAILVYSLFMTEGEALLRIGFWSDTTNRPDVIRSSLKVVSKSIDTLIEKAGSSEINRVRSRSW